MNNNTLNKLKSHYEELEIQPSSGLWDKLDEKLDEAPEIALKPSFQWWKYAAVIVLLTSVGTVVYFSYEKNKFNYKEMDYIVKKRLEQTVNPINPEFENQPVKSTDQLIQPIEKKKVVVSKENKTKNIQPEEKIEIIQQCYPAEIKNRPLAQEEKNISDTNPVIQTKIDEKPVLAEKKKTSYINADELLLGREFDKTREEAKKDERKFGVFNINKIFQKVDNVTFLGVTVYTDSK